MTLGALPNQALQRREHLARFDLSVFAALASSGLRKASSTSTMCLRVAIQRTVASSASLEAGATGASTSPKAFVFVPEFLGSKQEIRDDVRVDDCVHGRPSRIQASTSAALGPRFWAAQDRVT